MVRMTRSNWGKQWSKELNRQFVWLECGGHRGEQMKEQHWIYIDWEEVPLFFVQCHMAMWMCGKKTSYAQKWKLEVIPSSWVARTNSDLVWLSCQLSVHSAVWRMDTWQWKRDKNSGDYQSHCRIILPVNGVFCGIAAIVLWYICWYAFLAIQERISGFSIKLALPDRFTIVLIYTNTTWSDSMVKFLVFFFLYRHFNHQIIFQLTTKPSQFFFTEQAVFSDHVKRCSSSVNFNYCTS